MRHSLASTAQHELQERADDVQALLHEQPSELLPQQPREVSIREYSGQDEGKYLQVVDEQGNLLYFSDRRSLTRKLDPLTGTQGWEIASGRFVSVEMQVLRYT